MEHPTLELTLQDYFFEDQFEDQAAPISETTWATWFQQWLTAMASGLGDKHEPATYPTAYYELTLRLTDDAEIQALNAQYRQQDKPTDVLSFASLEVDSPALPLDQDNPLYLGDIVISVPTAQQQALAQNHSLATELAWLAVHGFLHLLGWDHPDEASLERMVKQQELLLRDSGSPLPSTEASLDPEVPLPKNRNVTPLFSGLDRELASLQSEGNLDPVSLSKL